MGERARLTPDGLAIDGRPVQLMRHEPGRPTWQHFAVVALQDHVDPDAWEVDEWGDMRGEGEDDGHPWVWTVDLDGARMGLEVGMLSIVCDVIGDSYDYTARSLLGALRGFEEVTP